jgi:hypothetical protein
VSYLVHICQNDNLTKDKNIVAHLSRKMTEITFVKLISPAIITEKV